MMIGAKVAPVTLKRLKLSKPPARFLNLSEWSFIICWSWWKNSTIFDDFRIKKCHFYKVLAKKFSAHICTMSCSHYWIQYIEPINILIIIRSIIMTLPYALPYKVWVRYILYVFWVAFTRVLHEITSCYSAKITVLHWRLQWVWRDSSKSIYCWIRVRIRQRTYFKE